MKTPRRLMVLGGISALLFVLTVVLPGAQSSGRVARSSSALGPARADAAANCQTFSRTYSFNWWLSASVNVGMCSNGTSMYSNWGPDCSVSKGPYSAEYSTNITWCGVYQNGGSTPQAGMNFHLNPYYAPGWDQITCWVRFTGYAQGNGMDLGRGGF